jgi:cyclic pyranopterin phosphate synthase
MGFTHIDANGNAIMVDVSGKEATARQAIAAGAIHMSRECFEAVAAGSVKKGDVLGVARVAGIMAAKRTSELIPLCHNLNITGCTVDFESDEAACDIKAVCTVRCEGKTGAEMEALTGAGLALLTVYDMCKALDKAMVISRMRLIKKTGGKSGVYIEEAAP